MFQFHISWKPKITPQYHVLAGNKAFSKALTKGWWWFSYPFIRPYMSWGGSGAIGFLDVWVDSRCHSCNPWWRKSCATVWGLKGCVAPAWFWGDGDGCWALMINRNRNMFQPKEWHISMNSAGWRTRKGIFFQKIAVLQWCFACINSVSCGFWWARRTVSIHTAVNTYHIHSVIHTLDSWWKKSCSSW